MNKILLSVAGAVAVLAAASPALADDRRGRGCDSDTETALIGAGIGALLGGAIGSGSASYGNQNEAAVVGALLGAAGGALVGKELGDGNCNGRRSSGGYYDNTYYNNGYYYNGAYNNGYGYGYGNAGYDPRYDNRGYDDRRHDDRRGRDGRGRDHDRRYDQTYGYTQYGQVTQYGYAQYAPYGQAAQYGYGNVPATAYGQLPYSQPYVTTPPSYGYAQPVYSTGYYGR